MSRENKSKSRIPTCIEMDLKNEDRLDLLVENEVRNKQKGHNEDSSGNISINEQLLNKPSSSENSNEDTT